MCPAMKINARQGAARRTGLESINSFSAIDDRFRVIFDVVKDGIFISDPGTGRFIEINRPGCAMFGYGEDDLVGRDIALLSSGIHPFTLEVAIENGRRIRLEGSQTFEWQCRKKSGALFWTEISLSYADIGGVPAIVAVIRDISERKRQEIELVIAHQKISAANEAKSAFLANMSHELRTPLNAIIGFSELMLTEILGPLGNSSYRDYIGDIHKSGLHLLALISDVLDLACLDAGKDALYEEDVDLHSLIGEACLMVSAQAVQSNLQIRNDISGDVPHIRGDEHRIKQIVLNLLSNAVKFTPEGGAVTITAEGAADGLRLQIVDTGIGIAESDMKNVTERFGQVDSVYTRKHQGTSLGLPLTKQLIELHGGRLGIKSKVDVGTTVSVTFPPERLIGKMGVKQRQARDRDEPVRPSEGLRAIPAQSLPGPVRITPDSLRRAF
jgi:PAS domain S-box-containing protein